MEQQVVRQQVIDFMQQKDKIESEIRELTSILTQNGVGMNDPLVDLEGFPINSIDVYQVRNARHKIICLQNDHKNIMKQIENGLQGYYSSISPNSCQATSMCVDYAEKVIHKMPFAKIAAVSQGSPAEYAGFRVNDLVVEFGSVNSTNFKNITDIATIVQHSEGSQVNVKIKRADQFLTFHLNPRKWIGKGLLGCSIVGL